MLHRSKLLEELGIHRVCQAYKLFNTAEYHGTVSQNDPSKLAQYKQRNKKESTQNLHRAYRFVDRQPANTRSQAVAPSLEC